MKIKDFSIITSGINSRRSIKGDVFYLQARDFMNDSSLDKKIKPSIDNSPRLGKHILHKGDVLVLSKGHNGFNAYTFQEDKSPSVASSIFLVIREIDKVLVPEYLCWYLNLKNTQDLLINMSRGSALPAINKVMVEELAIPLVGVEIQEKIIELDRLKKRETILTNQLDKLKSQKLEINLKGIIK